MSHEQACPERLMSIIDGVYYYDSLYCGSPPGKVIASDVREHQLGVDCSDILDPIILPDFAKAPPGPGEDDEALCGCGCAYGGLARYTTLDSPVLVADAFSHIRDYLVEYEEQDDEGYSVRRVARLFEFKGGGALKKKRILIGQELPPGTRLGRTNPLEGELAEAFGHYHCVKTSVGLFHVVTKSYLRPIPAPRAVKAATRARTGRAVTAAGRRAGRAHTVTSSARD